VQAGDGLLADVAALGEAHGAVVEPGLLGDDRVVEVDAVARAAVLDPQHVGRGLVDLHGAVADQRRLHALGVRAVADHVDSDVGADEQPEVAVHVGVLGGLGGLSPQSGEVVRAGADQREQALLQRALVQLGVEADVEPPQGVEERLQRRSLAQQQQLVGRRGDVQHAQVGEHLPLGRQQRRVAAGPGLERLDLVADLPVEERLGLGPGQRELAAL